MGLNLAALSFPTSSQNFFYIISVSSWTRPLWYIFSEQIISWRKIPGVYTWEWHTTAICWATTTITRDNNMSDNNEIPTISTRYIRRQEVTDLAVTWLMSDLFPLNTGGSNFVKRSNRTFGLAPIHRGSRRSCESRCSDWRYLYRGVVNQREAARENDEGETTAGAHYGKREMGANAPYVSAGQTYTVTPCITPWSNRTYLPREARYLSDVSRAAAPLNELSRLEKCCQVPVWIIRSKIRVSVCVYVRVCSNDETRIEISQHFAKRRLDSNHNAQLCPKTDYPTTIPIENSHS